MAKKYFDKFPVTSYNGFNIRNLTTSAKLINKYVNAPYNYFRYDIDHEQRADQVAMSYYGDQYMSWMIFYANGVTDPYYDWYLSEEEFNNFLIKKYGSIEVTQKRITGFVTNWFVDDFKLSPTQFDSQFGEFTEPHSNYWNPVFNSSSGATVYYVRKQNNNTYDTNKLIKVSVTDTSAFSDGDLVDLKLSTNGSTVGTAEINAVNSSYIFLKNVLGNIGTNYYIVQDSDATVYSQITGYGSTNDMTSNVWTITNISPEEYIYWTPFTVYDMEREKNNSKKNIRLVDPTLAIKIADKLATELGQ